MKKGGKAKVSSKKIASKKAKKRIPEKNVEVIIKTQVLGEAPEEKHFYVADGRRLKNLQELAEALGTMTEEIFMHHANEARNDFSNWVNDVFEEKSLADNLRSVKDAIEAQAAVLKRLASDIKKEVKNG